MPYLETVQELLEAKEGEHVQFKDNIPIKPFAFGASFQPPYSKRFFRTTFL